ncbi:hypothetical protein ABNQ38_31985 [Azospirillum sp. A29]|jgi:hypothetical protein|uniref:hypothetical protein n=1 Tax=Azospirillum sp. A29 TaxID=3160606 RepID=UPI0036722AFF
MPKITHGKSDRALRKTTMDERDRREDKRPTHGRDTRAKERYDKENERDSEKDRRELYSPNREQSFSKYGPAYVEVKGKKEKIFMVRDKKVVPKFDLAFRTDFWKPSADHGHICGICKKHIPGDTPNDHKNRGIDHKKIGLPIY